ncbi:MAG: hypothetical protein NT115_15795 [Proteobacteria bacterium]|nr:hypothetical protein [Pseudomonadota bacterium]
MLPLAISRRVLWLRHNLKVSLRRNKPLRGVLSRSNNQVKRDFISYLRQKVKKQFLSLRAQRSNLVALVTSVAMPQDCRVGCASSQ